MAFPTFGHSRINEKGITTIIAEGAKSKMTSFEVALTSRELYETFYRIHDHADKAAAVTRPLALVAAHPKETYGKCSPLYRRMDEFITLKVHERTGLSLTEFMGLPFEYVTHVLEVVKREIANQGRQDKKTLDALNANLDT